jgi:murein DD-endopeptidase MepM/ murein hydrolase activator NlpD
MTAALTDTVFVWPVPVYKDGRKPSISSGYGMRSTGNHPGVDIMYRRNPCGDVKLPTQSKCYEAPGYIPNGWGPSYNPAGGVPVLAYGPGKVVESKFVSKGNYIVIDHPLGWRTQYMHLANRKVNVGDTVSAGQRIGTIGHGKTYLNPGGYALNHLHFQLRYNGGLVDPAPYLKNKPVLSWSAAQGTSPLLYLAVAGALAGGFWYLRNR